MERWEAVLGCLGLVLCLASLSALALIPLLLRTGTLLNHLGRAHNGVQVVDETRVHLGVTAARLANQGRGSLGTTLLLLSRLLLRHRHRLLLSLSCLFGLLLGNRHRV